MTLWMNWSGAIGESVVEICEVVPMQLAATPDCAWEPSPVELRALLRHPPTPLG